MVDDSALIRSVLKRVLEEDPHIEVIGTAQDPFAAAEIIRNQVPDVITLDIEMPKMDGLTFLDKLMHQHPIPVVICSSLASAGSEMAMAALERGAAEIVAKPKIAVREFLEESVVTLCDAVKAAASTHPAARKRIAKAAAQPLTIQPKLTADAVLARGPASSSQAMLETTEKVIVVGASTGGTEALREFLEAMPADAPGIVIVQHMPEMFTARFAERLNGLCKIAVKEAANGDSVLRGHALIAPGNHHMLLKRSGARYFVEVTGGPLVSRHRPSVDVLFRSAARYAGRNAVGVIMTGMGDDGAHGMLEMKEAGAQTIAQNEATCAVFGMPAEAIRLGAVDKVVALNQIAAQSIRFAGYANAKA